MVKNKGSVHAESESKASYRNLNTTKVKTYSLYKTHCRLRYSSMLRGILCVWEQATQIKINALFDSYCDCTVFRLLTITTTPHKRKRGSIYDQHSSKFLCSDRNINLNKAVSIWKVKHFPGLLSRLLAAMTTMLVSEWLIFSVSITQQGL